MIILEETTIRIIKNLVVEFDGQKIECTVDFLPDAGEYETSINTAMDDDKALLLDEALGKYFAMH